MEKEEVAEVDIQPTEAIVSVEVACRDPEGTCEVEEEGEKGEAEPAELEDLGEFCLQCVHRPCLCSLLRLEMRMEMLREAAKNQDKDSYKGAEEDEAEPGEVVAEAVQLLHEAVTGRAGLLHREAQDLPAIN